MRNDILYGIGMLLAASGVQAHDGRVYVSGTITDNTCSLSPGSENINVAMGAVSQRQFYRAGDGSAWQPFAIDLQNCGSTASGVTVSFSGAADSRNTDLLALTAGESDASGIGIALYDQNKTLIPLGQESDVVTLSPGQASAHLQFYARYLADGGAVRPGTPMPPQPSFLPMNKFFLRCAIYWCLLPISWAQAGVVIGGTRFIYHAGAPALSVPVSNRSEASWLIDTHILPGGRWPGTKNEGNIMPFVVTPPLFMLSARQENSMRVVYTGAPLPADRESLFTLSIAAIPSGKPEANRVQMAFRSALKLLYRPDGLAGNPQQAYRHLIWSLTPDGATVRNPTPYYVTLFLLRANERAQDTPGSWLPLQRVKRTGAGTRFAALCAGKVLMTMGG